MKNKVILVVFLILMLTVSGVAYGNGLAQVSPENLKANSDNQMIFARGISIEKISQIGTLSLFYPTSATMHQIEDLILREQEFS